MKVTETVKDGLKRGFKIVVPAADVKTRMDVKLQELAKTANLPGFRVGKAPMDVLRQKYGQAALGEVVQQAVNDTTMKVLNEKSLRPAAQPQIDIKKMAENSDLEYDVEVEVLPDITVTDISKLSLEKQVSKVDKKAVDEALERIAKSNRKSVKVTDDRKSKKGDVVLIDFDGSVDGERRPGMKGEDHELELGSNSFIPGFEEQLTGKKAGETVSVKVTFPRPYHSKELEGKEAVFETVVKEVREFQLPAIDEAFAKELGQESLETLKKLVEEQIQREYDMFARSKLKRQLLDKLAETHMFDVPPSLLDGEFQAIWQQVQSELKAADEKYDEKKLMEEYREIAHRRVRLGLVLSEVGIKNNIQVPNDALNRALMAEARKYPGQEQRVMEFYQSNPQAIESLKAPIFEDLVVDFIVDKAKVTEKTVSLDELTHDPDEDFSVTDPNNKKAKAAPKEKKAK